MNTFSGQANLSGKISNPSSSWCAGDKDGIYQRDRFLEEKAWAPHKSINGICKKSMEIDSKPNCVVPGNQF